MLSVTIKAGAAALLCASFLFCPGRARAQGSPAHPNVIMIFTDDMGYSDISSFANTPLEVTTPNIDRISSEGLRMMRFYVSMPICSPSRAAVLSGRFSPRNQLTNYLNTREYNNNSDQNDYMAPANSHLPRAFQSAGYATGHIGKWHLGGGRDVDNPPSIRLYGYDEAYSTWESPNPEPELGIIYTPWDYNNLESGQVARWDRSRWMVDKTLDFLQRHQDKPCFITLWPDDMHTPFTPTPEMRAKYGGTLGQDNDRKNYRGVLEEYDRQIGRLLDGLTSQGVANNTIIFFTGDNGPAPDYGTDRTNGMRGKKLSLYEGGIRMPFAIRWPGHIPSGSTNSSTVMHTVDLLPTLAGLAGVSLPASATTGMDGEDLSAALLGTPVTRTKTLMWEYGRTSTVPRPGVNDTDRSPTLAMIDGNFKLLMNHNSGGKEFYNVATDPNEATNIASSNTAKVNQMAAALSAWQATLPNRTQAYPPFATVNFSNYGAENLASEPALRLAAGAASTARIDGVAGGPNPLDYVYAVHTDAAGKYTFLQVDPTTRAITPISNSDAVTTNTASAGTLTLAGGFDYSPMGDRLIFADSGFGANVGMITVHGGTHLATARLRSSALNGLTDLSALHDGRVAAVTGNGSKMVGSFYLAPNTWTVRVNEGQLIAAASGTTSLPPMSIGANSSSGQVTVYAGGDGETFRITNIPSGTPGITRLTQALLASVDFQDVAVDQANNIYGYDAAGQRILIVRATDSAIFSLSLLQISSRLGMGSQFAPTPYRGLTARMIDDTHSELFMASANAQAGIVRLKFGNPIAAVSDWQLY